MRYRISLHTTQAFLSSVTGALAILLGLSSCTTSLRLPEIEKTKAVTSAGQRTRVALRARPNVLRYNAGAAATGGSVQITLDNSFIELIKDRVTVEVTYSVVHAMRKPHAADQDADTHNSGKSSEIRLPIVAEVMNAAEESGARQAFIQAEESQTPLDLTGVWRIWCEHAGAPQVQGEDDLNPDNTNPNHVFEIHPVTQIRSLSVVDSLHPIEGYNPKDPDKAFQAIRKAPCSIRAGNGVTTLVTKPIGNNYIEFKLKPIGEPSEVPGGTLVVASIYDMEDQLIMQQCRMAFIQGSAAEKHLARLANGGSMHVLGTPRINLDTIWSRMQDNRRDELEANLPFEMIIVGDYGD